VDLERRAGHNDKAEEVRTVRHRLTVQSLYENTKEQSKNK